MTEKPVIYIETAYFGQAEPLYEAGAQNPFDAMQEVAKSMIEEIDKSEPTTAWRSMDSAPKDGTKVLLRDTENIIYVCEWDGAKWVTVEGLDEYYSPIAWTPIPG